MNIITYGINDLYLTGAPQITFFKTVYRRYTNFAVESIKIGENTNTNFNDDFEVIIPRYGDLMSKTYLAITLPEVYFSYNEFEFTAPTNVYLTNDEDNFNIVKEFMKYNTAAFRTIKRDTEVVGITTLDISSNLAILINGPGQVARNNFINLYTDASGQTYNDLDVRFLLRGCDIYSQISPLIAVDTSSNIVIDSILSIATNCINLSVKCQDYYFKKYYQTLEEYNIKNLKNLKFSWNERLAHNMIDNIEVHIGGEFIDRIDGDFLELYSQVTLKSKLEETYSKMIGNVSELTTYDQKVKPSYTLYLPLQFWFTKHIGSAFPLIASQHNDVIIKIKFKSINQCATIENLQDYDYTLEDLWNDKKYNLNCTLFVDYIFLDYLERKKFAQSAHEYLIETVQSDYAIIDYFNYSYHVDFKHPCKELLFFFQKEAYRTDDTGQSKNSFNNFTIDISNNTNSLNSAIMTLNGFEKVNKVTGTSEFYNLLQPYEHHKKIPNVGVYNYSFALVPEEIQPSGSLNMSRIKDVLFNFELKQSMFTYNKSDIDPLITVGGMDDEVLSTDVYFKIFGICYNILRIKNGYTGLAFSAF